MSMQHKNEAHIVDNMQKESDLIYYNDINNRNATYNKYFYSVSTNDSFRKSVNNNEKRFALPLKDAIKRFDSFDRVLLVIVGITVFTLGATYIVEKNLKNGKDYVNFAIDLSFLVVFTLICVCVDILSTADLVQSIYKQRIENFYDHLAVRCFDVMKTKHKNLDKTTLKKYNPAMARIVTQLLMSNMSEAETRQIITIVDNIKANLRSSNKEEILQINSQLECAMKIIKNALENNPKLYTEILDVYRGKIPAVFVLNPNQNVR